MNRSDMKYVDCTFVVHPKATATIVCVQRPWFVVSVGNAEFAQRIVDCLNACEGWPDPVGSRRSHDGFSGG